jgi:hypothetical protein
VADEISGVSSPQIVLGYNSDDDSSYSSRVELSYSLLNEFDSIPVNDRLPIRSGVPQGRLLSPLLYTLYTYDLPTTRKTTIGTFADDTAIFATHETPATASSHLQEHLSLI